MESTKHDGLNYAAFNKPLFQLLHLAEIKKLLDVGCGTGELGKAIKKENPFVQLHGITFSAEEAQQASLIYDQVYIHDINDLSLSIENGWDCIIFSHVLEHTHQPGIILKHYVSLLKEDGTIIIALPNIMFFKQRLQFLKGNFKYSENGGLMDNTHYRFFDFASAHKLVENAGLDIIISKGQGAFPLGPLRSVLPKLAGIFDQKMVDWWPGFFSFQFLIVAKKRVV